MNQFGLRDDSRDCVGWRIEACLTVLWANEQAGDGVISKVLDLQMKDITYLMEGDKQANLELIEAQARSNLDKLLAFDQTATWEENGKVKGEKPCLMYKTGVDSRVASKGVVANVDGTLQELAEMLSTEEYYTVLDPQMKEFQILKEIKNTPEESIHINYIRFKGIGPVSDRDFVLVERYLWQGDKYYAVSSSCDFPFPEVKGVVRAECIIAGYIGEKVDEKTIKVTYVSDGDIKGSIPGFVKNLVSQGQGEVASRVNDCLKQLRAKKAK